MIINAEVNMEKLIITESFYSMRQVAKELNIAKVGRNNLYYYLKELKIIKQDRKSFPEYLLAGYFKHDYGTQNKSSSLLYLKTVVTEKGLKWLKEEIKSKILEAQKEYFKNYKKK
jgi:hypothetical protein